MKKLIYSIVFLCSLIFFYQVLTGKLEKYKPAPEAGNASQKIKIMLDYKKASQAEKLKTASDIVARLSLDKKLNFQVSSLKELNLKALTLKKCLDENLNEKLTDQKFNDIALTCIISFDWLKK